MLPSLQLSDNYLLLRVPNWDLDMKFLPHAAAAAAAGPEDQIVVSTCLLYTSDAADE